MEKEIMVDTVILEWFFTPKDYFEDEINIRTDDYEMIIKEGSVEAYINPEIYEKKHKMRDSLHKKLNNMFLGVQLLTHKPYLLSNASICKLYPDGRKVISTFYDTCVKIKTVCNDDFIIKDKAGNIISDSRKDRIEKKKELAELAETYSSDPVAANLLASYNAAVNDPDNELIHLYEIRESLSKYFCDKKKACQALKLNGTDWSRLGQLANDEPLKQGRHRGRSTGKLRDATKEELTEARKISSDFVVAYLVFLDKKDN